MWCGIYTNKSYGVAVSIRDTTNRCNEYNTKFVYKWNKVRGMGVELYPNAGKVYYGHHSEAKKSYTRKKAEKTRENRRKKTHIEHRHKQKPKRWIDEPATNVSVLSVWRRDKYPLREMHTAKVFSKWGKATKTISREIKTTTEPTRNMWMKRKTKSRSNQNRQTAMCMRL